VTVKLEWLIGSDKALGEIGTKAAEKGVLMRTLKKAAAPMDTLASSLAPVDTGRLQTSVITGTKLTRGQKSSAYKNGTKGVAEIHVGTKLSRGLFQEFGTVKMGPHPFMRPAWDATKAQALAIISTELWVEIKKAAARAARKRAKALL
jgi:HK97 gp10 family phage protein